jgi:ribosomal protein S18 acetylase RimI-like enzyme
MTSIRHARIEDAPALGQVMVASYLAGHRGQMPEEAWRKRQEEWTPAVSAAAWERTLRDIEAGEAPSTCIFVALDERGEVAGLVMGGPEEAVPGTGAVYAVYVHPDHQGRGHGRALVQAAAAYLAREGMTALRIGCLAANARSRGFYEALGGQVVTERLFDEEGYLLPEVVYGWADTSGLTAGYVDAPSEPG